MGAGGAAPIPGPALAVCGWSGSGKTTALEAVIPELTAQGLAVGVVKHDAHGLDVDRPGKDSDRLFRAGADVVVHAPDEALARRHGATELGAVVGQLLADHDLVLVEGHKGTPLPKIWLASPDEPAPPAEVENVLAVLPWGSDRGTALLSLVRDWLPRAWRRVPVMGGVLVGGASARMGRPKHLLTLAGATFLERVTAAIRPSVREVVVVGDAEVPGSPSRLADAPDADGPLAGILAAARWAPDRAWVIAACDLPRLRREAVEWLIAQREPGRWAVVPGGPAGVEPLLALYEPQARLPLERLAAQGLRAPRLLAAHPRAHVVAPPPELRECWDNVNTAEDLAALGGDGAGEPDPGT